MTTTEPTPGTVALRVSTIAVVALASIFMEASGWASVPETLRPEGSWMTLHALVALAFSACAAVAWRIAPESPAPARLMVLFPLVWIPQTFYWFIEDLGWLWPLLRGVDLSWGIIAGLIVMLYPSGRIADRVDRLVATTAIVATVVNFVVVVLFAGSGSVPCECAPNVYRVADAPLLFAIVDIGYRVVGSALISLVAIRQLVRWVRGTVPARTVAFLMPAALLAWVVTISAQTASYATSTTFDQVLSTISLIALASIPISYVAGVNHVQNLRGRVADLMRITRDGADRVAWGDSLRRVLRDPSLVVYWWDDEEGRFQDASGEPLTEDPADERSRQSLLPVASPGGRPIAIIRHDRVLTDNARLLDGVSSALRLSVDNGRLRSEVERTLEQVRESRQRIVEASARGQRRVERDLHDGAQQRLVTLGLSLRLVANHAGSSGQADLAEELEGAIEELGQALRELRELAHGIHPSLLSQGGLSLAIPELAGRCPVPVEVEVQADGRLPELVESTAYFVVAEALANVAKHSGAARAWVKARIDEEGALRLSVRDDGRGGADLTGAGTLGMDDRVEAVGGALELRSDPGRGTTVRVRIPLDPSTARA